ncbi:MAG: carbohydrate kinase [Myxococcales bacterium]|nr:carbohydrate kinase [Myxococcales bacterium]
MHNAPHVVAFGELLFDLFPDGPRLGGAAANVAFHARQLGARVTLVSRVGADTLGDTARAELGRCGVDVRFVGVDPVYPTGTVRVELAQGEPVFRIGDAAAWDRIEHTPELGRAVADADVFVFGTLAQRSLLGSAALTKILGDLPAPCLRVCDLNLRPPHVTEAALETALAHAQLLKLNELEARRVEELLGVHDAAVALVERGVLWCAVTRGGAGAVLRSREVRLDHPGYALRCSDGDPVGAGDAFTACLAIELVRATSPETALSRANRYASFVASERGAMPVPPEPLLAELAMLRAP